MPNNSTLILGEALEEMAKIPSESVDLIVCDPPYGTIKGLKVYKNSDTSWDTVIDIKKMLTEYKRILKPRGKAVIFSQNGFTQNLRAESDTQLSYVYPLYWHKNSWGNSLSAGACPLSVVEDISVFSKAYDNNLDLRYYLTMVSRHVDLSSESDAMKHFFEQKDQGPTTEYYLNITESEWSDFISTHGLDKLPLVRSYESMKSEVKLRDYAKQMIDHSQLSRSEILKIIGGRAQHFLGYTATQFAVSSRKTYDALTKLLDLTTMDNYMTYDELKSLPTHFISNPQSKFNLPDGSNHITNLLTYSKDKDHYHPTQKPVDLLKFLIMTYSNPGDIVLDNTMGSGSTGVAALRAGRRFIGIELSQEYYNIATKRIKQEYTANPRRP